MRSSTYSLLSFFFQDLGRLIVDNQDASLILPCSLNRLEMMFTVSIHYTSRMTQGNANGTPRAPWETPFGIIDEEGLRAVTAFNPEYGDFKSFGG